MRMTWEECLESMTADDKDAADLLNEADPKLARRFKNIDRAIGKLLDDVKRHFPDANFYTVGGDGFALLLGPSHDMKERQDQRTVAISGTHATIGGGDW